MNVNGFDLEAIERDYRNGRFGRRLSGLVECLLSRGEDQVQRVLSHILSSEKGAESVCRELGLPRIVSVEREVNITGSRPDFVAAHEDGSVSIIEVKRGGIQRDVVAGIGQLSMYAVKMAGNHGVTIRRILAWDFRGSLEDERAICKACDMAGVLPLPLGSMDDHEAELKRTLGEKVGT